MQRRQISHEAIFQQYAKIFSQRYELRAFLIMIIDEICNFGIEK
jgi:hypothetical protein